MSRAPALVPELAVRDLAASLRFWCGLCGFAVLYDRPEEGFVCLEGEGGARVMLDQLGLGRDWVTGPLERPLGRGINLEFAVTALATRLAALDRAAWPLFLGPEEKTYRVGAAEVTVRQFLVQDPDGYLLRFSERLPDGG
ncbi:MAG: VOC family protein [Acetobacteraceae bacterium]|nr:VOC family protein [Acetobacteraceae bacterium]